MPNYTSVHTGAQVDNAVTKALPLDEFAYYEDYTINNKTYHILWKVRPTNNNTVYGLSVDPNTGQDIKFKSVNNVYTILPPTELSSEGILIIN